jgi:hypothetical protein
MTCSSSKISFNAGAVFPVIVLYDDGDFSMYDELDAYIYCSTLDVKAGERGRFAKSRVIDSGGMIWHVKGATVLKGVGPFWGYKIIFPRTIMVEPMVQGEPTQSNLVAVRVEICKRLRARKSIITIQSKKVCSVLCHRRALAAAATIESASAISEILLKLLSIDSPEG